MPYESLAVTGIMPPDSGLPTGSGVSRLLKLLPDRVCRAPSEQSEQGSPPNCSSLGLVAAALSTPSWRPAPDP
jgi:hypothetical protein